jgi:hypothetical protein
MITRWPRHNHYGILHTITFSSRLAIGHCKRKLRQYPSMLFAIRHFSFEENLSVVLATNLSSFRTESKTRHSPLFPRFFFLDQTACSGNFLRQNYTICSIYMVSNTLLAHVSRDVHVDSFCVRCINEACIISSQGFPRFNGFFIENTGHFSHVDISSLFIMSWLWIVPIRNFPSVIDISCRIFNIFIDFVQSSNTANNIPLRVKQLLNCLYLLCALIQTAIYIYESLFLNILTLFSLNQSLQTTG